MSYADEAEAIRTRFRNQWTSTPIAWPNVSFDPLKNSAGSVIAAAPWVRLEILPADAAQADLAPVGSRRWRHTGLVTVQVMVPANTGDGKARELAESACAVFRGVTADDVTYGAPYVTTGGDDGRGWYTLTVWVPYYRDSLH